MREDDVILNSEVHQKSMPGVNYLSTRHFLVKRVPYPGNNSQSKQVTDHSLPNSL